MRSTAEWLNDRLNGDTSAWTISACWRDGTRAEYAVVEVFSDGVMVEYIKHEDRDCFGRFTVLFSALSWIKILEEGE